jgi:hypothetical protein
MQQHYAMPQQQSLPDRSSSIQTRWNQPVGAGIASFKRQRFERGNCSFTIDQLK